jgi:hypothetical protein
MNGGKSLTLKYMVDTYLKNNKYDWILSECNPGKRSVEEVIKYAVYTWTPELKVCHRNYSDENNVREEMIGKLQKSKGTLGTPTSFEEIMEWVYSERIEGFGPVGVYDTALRIAIHKGIYPSMVYIHAGSVEGTENLLGHDYQLKRAYYFMNDLHYPVLDPNVYPKEMNKLEPYHVENFLCQKKELLKKISN